MSTQMWPHRGALLGLAVVALLSCGGEPPTDPIDPPPVDPPGGDGPSSPATLSISEAELSFVALGDSAQLNAEVRDGDGKVMAGEAIEWSSTDSDVATVNSRGVVTAVSNGAAEVVAKSGALADTVSVEVSQVAASITLSPSTFRLTEGETLQVDAAVTDANGVPIEGAEIVWSSGKASVATVDANGVVTAVRGRGSATLTAAVDGEVGAATVEVPGRILFVSDTDGDFEIYTMDEDGAHVVQLTHNTAADSSAVWSPDGSKIAFISHRDGSRQIYVMNADGSGQRNLTNDTANVGRFSWSPFSTHIAFESDRDGDFDLYVVDVAGGTPKNITNTSVWEAQPAWSPDGYMIAHASNYSGNANIHVIRHDGVGGNGLTIDPASDVMPVWSPDGSKLAFISDRDGRDEIYVMDANGQNQTRLTTTGIPVSRPVWSPDGRRLAFTSEGLLTSIIYVVHVDGGAETRLTPVSSLAAMPAWAPDGSKLLYISEVGSGIVEVFAMDPDGSNVEQVTTRAGVTLSPAWRPWP